MATSELEWDIGATKGPEAPGDDWTMVAKDIFSGTVGGIAQVLVGQPFDTTKVRLQSAPEGTYSGAMDVVKQLLKNEGFKGFYKGTMTPLVGVGACVSVQFAVNEGMKRVFTNSNKEKGHARPELLSYPQLYISGSAAGVANSFLASPIEQIRIRLQTQTGKPGTLSFNGPIPLARTIYDVAGMFRGIYRGFVPTVLREGHGMGMYFMAAEACVKHDMKMNNIPRSGIPTWRVCIYGGIAGITMWLMIYPIDVVKSRMQTDNIDPAKWRYKTMRDCFAATARESGVGGFFRGFPTTLLRAFPVNAATFLAFEITRRALG